jgi:hypothetical protein
MKLRVRDICHGSLIAKRAIVIQQKTQRPVHFEIMEPALIHCGGPKRR